MNPFTRSLLRRLNDRRLKRFVENWDQLEALVIRIYKSGQASPEDEAALQDTLAWLNRHYPGWRSALDEYWHGLQAGGRPLQNDPFDTLLSIQTADDILENWTAMQILPAAREALNQYLIDRIGE